MFFPLRDRCSGPHEEPSIGTPKNILGRGIAALQVDGEEEARGTVVPLDNYPGLFFESPSHRLRKGQKGKVLVLSKGLLVSFSLVFLFKAHVCFRIWDFFVFFKSLEQLLAQGKLLCSGQVVVINKKIAYIFIYISRCYIRLSTTPFQ